MGKYTSAVDDHLTLPARVGVSQGEAHRLRRQGKPIPNPISVRFLIDTGAKRTTLSPEFIRQFGLASGTRVQVLTASGTLATRFYWMQIEFPEAGLAAFEHVQVASLAMPAALSQFHGLLGRDLLGSLDSLLYEGQNNRYTLRDRSGPFSWLRRWL
jgi:hypothetical protein